MFMHGAPVLTPTGLTLIASGPNLVDGTTYDARYQVGFDPNSFNPATRGFSTTAVPAPDGNGGLVTTTIPLAIAGVHSGQYVKWWVQAHGDDPTVHNPIDGEEHVDLIP